MERRLYLYVAILTHGQRTHNLKSTLKQHCYNVMTLQQRCINVDLTLGVGRAGLLLLILKRNYKCNVNMPDNFSLMTQGLWKLFNLHIKRNIKHVFTPGVSKTLVPTSNFSTKNILLCYRYIYIDRLERCGHLYEQHLLGTDKGNNEYLQRFLVSNTHCAK